MFDDEIDNGGCDPTAQLIPTKSSTHDDSVCKFVSLNSSDNAEKKPLVSAAVNYPHLPMNDYGGMFNTVQVPKTASLSPHDDAALAIDLWPPWLSAVAGEAIRGWSPRKAESFEKLEKVCFSLSLSLQCQPNYLPLRAYSHKLLSPEVCKLFG